jgi:hypothetical protein
MNYPRGVRRLSFRRAGSQYRAIPVIYLLISATYLPTTSIAAVMVLGGRHTLLLQAW